MPQCCAVPFCPEKKGGHKFPRDETIAKQWIVAIRRDGFTPSKHSRVCKKHFKPDDYELPKESYAEHPTPKLKPNTVPSQFTWNLESKEGKEIERKLAEKALRRQNKQGSARLCSNTEENKYFQKNRPIAIAPKPSGIFFKSQANQSIGESSGTCRLIKISVIQNIGTLAQCRCCGEFTQDIVNAVDAPYVSKNKTILAFNDVSVKLDFDDALPKTVCRHCHEKLQELWNFVKVVNKAQNTLIKVINLTNNVATDKKQMDVLIGKKECKSPTPEEIEVNCNTSLIDNETGDDKVGIVDSLTVNETISVPLKRKPCNSAPEKLNQAKRKKDIASSDDKLENKEIVIDIKEEASEPDEEGIGVLNEKQPKELDSVDVEPETKPSAVELATSVLLYKTVNDDQQLN